MRLASLFLSFVLALSPLQEVGRRRTLFPAGGGGTWTHTQRVIARSAFGTVYNCSGSVCTFTVASTGSGHGLVILTFDSGTQTISSVSGGCSGSWVAPSGANITNATGALSGAYCVSSSSGTTSVAVTFSSAPTGLNTGDFEEFAWSGSSISFDVSGAQSNSSSSSPPGVTLTLTGTSDAIVQQLAMDTGQATAASSPYNTNFTATGTDSNPLSLTAFTYAMNLASGTGPTWTSNNDVSIANAIAMKGN